MSETRWFWMRCNREQPGNPRRCPWCGHTVYRPVYPSRQEKPNEEAEREGLARGHGGEEAGVGLVVGGFVYYKATRSCSISHYERRWHVLHPTNPIPGNHGEVQTEKVRA